MAKIKFNLNFGGEQIRTLADLRENFSIEDVLDNYHNGTLTRWLDSRFYDDELERVKAIKATDARGILAELIRIFGVASDPAEIEADLSLVDYLEGGKKFWEDIKANGLDGMDTLRDLRQELESVKQERDAIKQEFENLKQKMAPTIHLCHGTHEGPFRVVHYINQFYAGIGCEEKADYQPEIRDGVVGLGMILKGALGSEVEVVATVICGDSYFASNMDKASADIIAMIKKYNPDAFIAGPAFNAVRYGTACGAMCEAVSKQLGIPVVSGMYPENPGVEMYKKSAYIVQTKDSAVDMRKAVLVMAKLALKLLKGEKLGTPTEEGYIAP